MKNVHTICNTPTGWGLFRGIAGNFSRFSQIILEFIDNIISNLLANWGNPNLLHCVDITLEEREDCVYVTIRDGGTGIKDLDRALTVAGGGKADSPLNEHGMGLKHALASVDAGETQEWSIQTRTTEDAALNRYKLVHAPYDIGHMYWTEEPGKGDIEGDTGTVIRFRCPKLVFNTLKPATKRSQVSFADLVSYLVEELRYIYAGILWAGNIWINLTAIQQNGNVIKHLINKPLVPKWIEGTVVELPEVEVDLGGGKVTIRCRYGLIDPSEENVFYYKANMESSGVEISINGRVIEHNLFSCIFEETPHPSQNRFLAQVDLKSDSRSALPATKAAKNAFRVEDPKLEALFRWIRSNVRRPDKDSRTKERKLVDCLREKKAAEPGVLRVTQEEGAYQSLGLKVKMDLFVSRVDGVTIYEAKAGASKAENAYQMMLYWDGCAMDGKPANEAVLIAERHPEEVKRLVEQLNRQFDPTGMPYRFRLVTWADEEIDVGSVA